MQVIAATHLLPSKVSCRSSLKCQENNNEEKKEAEGKNMAAMICTKKYTQGHRIWIDDDSDQQYNPE